MVSKHGAEFLQSGLNLLFSVLHHYQFFIGFHIGTDRSRAHMGLVTENRVSHIIVMWNLYAVEKNHILKLSGISHHGALPHDCVPADKGAVTDFRVLSDNGRAVDIRGRSHTGGSGDPYVLSPALVFLRIKGFSQFFYESSNLRKDFPGISLSLKKLFCDRFIQIKHVFNSEFFHFSFPPRLAAAGFFL